MLKYQLTNRKKYRKSNYQEDQPLEEHLINMEITMQEAHGKEQDLHTASRA